MKFKETQVNISTLLLDPNNPRLVTDLNRKTQVPDSDLDDARMQEELLSRFKTQRSNDENEEFTEIKSKITSDFNHDPKKKNYKEGTLDGAEEN